MRGEERRGEEKEEILQIHPIFLLRRRRGGGGGGSDHSKRKVKSTEAGRCTAVLSSLRLLLHLS